MRIGLCYESVLPARGGCEHYISDLARRLARDGHAVHLFACRWDAAALPTETVYQQLPTPTGPRYRRPWQFAEACLAALAQTPVDVSMGFDKTFGQDVLYPQGGLHSASRAHSFLKHRPGPVRGLAKWVRVLDPTSYSFARLERRQYLSEPRPAILVNSQMVRRHFEEYLGLPESAVQVLYSAIDPARFVVAKQSAARASERKDWNVSDDEPVGLFVAMNYRLKGLAPLIRSLVHVPSGSRLKLVVVGGAKFAKYEDLANRLGVRERIVFLGFRADPRDCYFAADFLVHPTFYDPCSLVALEALTCGLPVVTSPFNGASELLNPPANGLIVQDPHDARELASALLDMADAGRLPARQLSALEAGRRWTFEDHYRELLAVFEGVVRGRGA